MSKFFTKSDIEIMHFEESLSYHEEQRVSELYEYLKELKEQGIYIVDVTLISTHAAINSLSKVFNQYMIRIVRPKYEVELFVGKFNGYGYEFDYHKSETIGIFKTAEEAEKFKKEYLAKRNENAKYYININYRSLLNQEI